MSLIKTVAGGVLIGTAAFFGIKVLGGKPEESASSGGGSGSFAGELANKPDIFNINIEATEIPNDFFAASPVVESKKESRSSSRSSSVFRSTNRGTASTNKVVDIFTPTSSGSIDRFASNSSGAVADRYAQQSVSSKTAATRSLFSVKTKKEKESEE